MLLPPLNLSVCSMMDLQMRRIFRFQLDYRFPVEELMLPHQSSLIIPSREILTEVMTTTPSIHDTFTRTQLLVLVPGTCTCTVVSLYERMNESSIIG
jgi:hypothetical protein